jgi:tetratricopeptide (TPR) repeat protein
MCSDTVGRLAAISVLAAALAAFWHAPAAAQQPELATSSASESAQPAQDLAQASPPVRQTAPEAQPATADQLAQQPAPESQAAVTASATTVDEPLVPSPDPVGSGPAEVQVASFKGVTPGVTTADEVEQSWGAPNAITQQGNTLVQSFTVEPFERVEVAYFDGRVSSLVIRFDRDFPADVIAEQLGLTGIQPVLISNELGEILGQVYPERGVLFAFAPSDSPGKPSMRVGQVVLEPITAEPFVIRAETFIDSQPELALRDVEQTLLLDPTSARAHWLQARLMVIAGEYEQAELAGGEAVRLEPQNARYRVTHARILGLLDRLAEASQEAQQAVNSSQRRPHIKARALCLLGDLAASGSEPDYKTAIQFHMQAIEEADALSADPHPAIRLVAKEVLVDAHLGAAHDVAWGTWTQKDVAVSRWLAQAEAFAEDLVENEGRSEELQFRVSTRALAACVAVRGELDPDYWVNQALRTGRQLIAETDDPFRKAQIQWGLGMALYDALQTYQMCNDHDTALKYGELAIQYLEQSRQHNLSSNAAYLLGRLCFRLGAVHAIRDGNHPLAVTWFDKALGLLSDIPADEASGEIGRDGESFVSMGVSYWEAGQHDKAVELTRRGLDLIQQAVEQGILDEAALAVPYNNLASMNRQLGHETQADEFEELANTLQETVLR